MPFLQFKDVILFLNLFLNSANFSPIKSEISLYNKVIKVEDEISLINNIKDLPNLKQDQLLIQLIKPVGKYLSEIDLVNNTTPSKTPITITETNIITTTSTPTSIPTSTPLPIPISTISSAPDTHSPKIVSSTIRSKICPDNQIEDEKGECKCKDGFHQLKGSPELLCEKDEKANNKATGPKISGGAIAGIVAGSVVVVGLIGGLVYYLKTKEKLCFALDSLPPANT